MTGRPVLQKHYLCRVRESPQRRMGKAKEGARGHLEERPHVLRSKRAVPAPHPGRQGGGQPSLRRHSRRLQVRGHLRRLDATRERREGFTEPRPRRQDSVSRIAAEDYGPHQPAEPNHAGGPAGSERILSTAPKTESATTTPAISSAPIIAAVTTKTMVHDSEITSVTLSGPGERKWLWKP